MRSLCRLALVVATAASVELSAQQPPTGGMVHTPGMQHTPGMEHTPSGPMPTQSGQAAFATVAEIVKLLEADSTTDWRTVDLEALRQHLIDMDAVVMRARVRHSSVTGGLSMDVTGDAPVAASIKRMVGNHASMLPSLGAWRATTVPIANGLRLTVVANNANDSALVARIRGLGFVGLLTQDEHHAQHHLLIAKGAGAAAHGHGGQ